MNFVKSFELQKVKRTDVGAEWNSSCGEAGALPSSLKPRHNTRDNMVTSRAVWGPPPHTGFLHLLDPWGGNRPTSTRLLCYDRRDGPFSAPTGRVATGAPTRRYYLCNISNIEPMTRELYTDYYLFDFD